MGGAGHPCSKTGQSSRVAGSEDWYGGSGGDNDDEYKYVDCSDIDNGDG